MRELSGTILHSERLFGVMLGVKHSWICPLNVNSVPHITVTVKTAPLKLQTVEPLWKTVDS